MLRLLMMVGLILSPLAIFASTNEGSCTAALLAQLPQEDRSLTSQQRIALRCVQDCLSDESLALQQEIFSQISQENLSQKNKEIILKKYSAKVDDFNVLWRLQYFGFNQHSPGNVGSLISPQTVRWINSNGDEITTVYSGNGSKGPAGRKMRIYSDKEQLAIKDVILHGGKLNLEESAYFGHQTSANIVKP